MRLPTSACCWEPRRRTGCVVEGATLAGACATATAVCLAAPAAAASAAERFLASSAASTSLSVVGWNHTGRRTHGKRNACVKTTGGPHARAHKAWRITRPRPKQQCSAAARRLAKADGRCARVRLQRAQQHTKGRGKRTQRAGRRAVQAVAAGVDRLHLRRCAPAWRHAETWPGGRSKLSSL